MASEQQGPGIAAGLRSLAVPLSDLHQMPGNPRRGDVDSVKRSYARFGQMKPIVAQSDGMIIAGNHQFMAAKALGWAEIAVVRSDFDQVTAEAFALADNRTSELGSYDPSDLLSLIDAVRSDGDAELIAAISYSAEAIEAIRKSLESGLPEPGDASTVDSLTSVYGVIVECADEAEQVALLREMSEMGRRVRALMG